MGVMWGYVWGIWWWRITGESMDSDRLRIDLGSIPPSFSTLDELRKAKVQELRDRGIAQGIPSHVPTDVVFSGKRLNVRNRRIVVHMWNGFVPAKSICSTGKGDYVASPEFCLLQVASRLKKSITETLRPWQFTVILTELVCEFCGTYSKQNTTRGFKKRKKVLTSVGQLIVFCGRMSFEHGAQSLRKAVSWALDNLNSPMETALYLLLCLPVSYGGLALPRPISNKSVAVPKVLWAKTRLRHVVPDLCWPEVKLMVEYNGKDSHDGREVKDQERQEIVQDMGYTMITFRKEDLYNRDRFMAKASSVARYLRRSLPEKTTSFDELQILLHNMLLRHERWI